MVVTTHGVIYNVPILCVPVFLLFCSSAVTDKYCNSDSPNCVCSYDSLKADLRKTILLSDAIDLISKIQSFKCQQFHSLPSVLVTSSSSSGGYRPPSNNAYGSQTYGNRAYDSQGYENEAYGQYIVPHKSDSDTGENSPYNPEGNNEDFPEVPGPHFGAHKPTLYYTPYNLPRLRKKRQAPWSSEDQRRLNKAVQNLPVDNTPHSYAFLGHRIQMNCDDSNMQNPFLNQGKRYEWIHSNGNPVYAPAASVNSATGDLTIPATQLTDIDVYNCSIISPSGEIQTISHQLSIVTDSIHWLSIKSYYDSPAGCKTGDMEEIEKHLRIWIAEYICPVCTVHDTSVICEAPAGGTLYEIAFALTAFNFETEIDSRIDVGLCPEMCIQAIHLLLLNIVQESVSKLFARPIQVTTGNILYPRPEREHFELMTGCLAGFEYHHQICFPCRPGHYSVRGESECVQCSHGSFQASLAASRCIPCKEGDDTVENGAKSSSACLPESIVEAYHSVEENRTSAAAAIIIIILILLCIIACVICCTCCSHTKIGGAMRRCCCFPFASCCGLKVKKTSPKIMQTQEVTTQYPNPVSENNIIVEKQEISVVQQAPEIHESMDQFNKTNEVRQTSAASKKQLKKIVKSKVPHMWKSSKRQFKYQNLADHEDETSDSEDSDSETTSVEDVKGRKASLRRHSSHHETPPVSRHSIEVDKFLRPSKRNSYSPPRRQSLQEPHSQNSQFKANVGVQTMQNITEEKPQLRSSTWHEFSEKSLRRTSTAVSEKRHPSLEDTILPKVRVRDTVKKINAVSRFSKMSSKANNTPERTFPDERFLLACRRITQDEATLTSADRLRLDSQREHNWRRCITPSLRQSKFMPPPPPPRPPI